MGCRLAPITLTPCIYASFGGNQHGVRGTAQPTSILDRRWIQRTPPYLEQTSKLLRRMHKLHQCKAYRDALAKKPKLKTQLVQKLAASEVCTPLRTLRKHHTGARHTHIHLCV